MVLGCGPYHIGKSSSLLYVLDLFLCVWLRHNDSHEGNWKRNWMGATHKFCENSSMYTGVDI